MGLTSVSVLLTALLGGPLPAAAAPATSVDRLEFDNHGCYGLCPRYEATIFDDGRVRYRGLEFVHVYGERWRKIGRVRARRLIRRVARAKERREPRLWVTDKITTTTTAYRGERVAVIDNNHGWGPTPTALRARRIERRVRWALGARRLAVGPPGCEKRSMAARLIVPRGASSYGGTATDRVEQQFFDRIVTWLADRPTTRVELWVTAPARQRPAAIASLRAVQDALGARSIAPGRIAWARVFAEEDGRDDAVRVVHLRAAPPRCTAPPR